MMVESHMQRLTMRIQGSQNTDTNDKAITEKSRVSEATATRAERSEASSQVRGETVLISSQASQAAEASAAVDRRFADRVQSLKQQVQSGTYHVDRRRLAEKIIEQELTPRKER
jgi:flagellar biosynthesis anti-sigma factor FlgM